MQNRTYNMGNYIIPEETKNGICIDIGCNLGDFTNTYKHHFNKIYYLEPQKMLFDNLVERFKESTHISGINKAVWSDSNLTIQMVSHSNSDCGSVAVKGEHINGDWTNNIVNEVETISIENLIDLIGEKIIDYLKIDCETSEYPFLINKDLSMFKYIGIELHCQMGEKKYNDLLNWIGRTHTLISGDNSFIINKNQEVLYQLK